MPACGRFSARIRRAASSIAATAALLSAPRIVPPAFRTTPSSTTGSSAAVGGTVSRCAQRKIGTPPFCEVAGSRASRLPASEPIRGPASSSSTSSARRLEIRADPVGDRALLARWARDRGQLGEELEDVRHGPSVRGAVGVLRDGHGRFGHLARSGRMREREDDVIRLCAESASVLPGGVAAGEPERTLTFLATTRGRRHETPAARRRARRRDLAVRDGSGARGVGQKGGATSAPATTHRRRRRHRHLHRRRLRRRHRRHHRRRRRRRHHLRRRRISRSEPSRQRVRRSSSSGRRGASVRRSSRPSRRRTSTP